MVLSKRERILAIVTGVVVVALLVNSVIIDPVRSKRSQTKNERLELEARLDEANILFQEQRVQERTRRTMLEGLRSDTEAESRVARALDEWSRDARLMLTSVKPERAAGSNGMHEITFVIAGRGSLEAVAWFLYQVETAELPLKIKDMQLGSTSESGESMSLQLRLSAIYLGTGQKSSESSSRPRPPEANDEERLL